MIPIYALALIALALPGAVVNGGFEAAETHAGWTLHVYGAQPALTLDTAIRHGGAQSLRISASEPSDTALGQELQLVPGGWYRLRGWVRTRGLDPRGNRICGTFQAQRPGGSGVIASGASHRGDTGWTEVPITFRAPPDGRTRIAVFFVGYGKGTGAAWFDDITLEEIPVAMSTVKITRRPLVDATISPLQYGQFIEYLADLVGAMWAEKLYDNSFEGLSTYNVAFIRETDFREKPWHPSGATNRAQYTFDEATKVSGKRSQKIAIDGGAQCVVGISQDGVAVKPGVADTFSCWLKQDGIAGPVRVRLHGESRTYVSAEIRATDTWRKVTAKLAAKVRDTNATLSIEFRGPGTLWLDNASLMPADNVDGWRADVVEAVRALRPGVIRFGGSPVDYPEAGEYEWRKTIGDPDHRIPFRSWGGLQPMGAGLEEIVRFCYLVGAEPLMCVRFIGSTPEEAAAQVEYFNGAATTPMGALRAKNGHPKPYGIVYWQVGNEVRSPEYDAHLAAFCAAMKKADPSIKIMSSYPTPADIKSAGPLLNYVCPHHYDCGDLPGCAADFDAIRDMIRENAPGRPIKIGVTEWNTTAGEWGTGRAWLWTLSNALACARYHNLMHRRCDLVEIANRSNLTNSFCSGIVQTDNRRLFKTPCYYAQQLYATLAGDRPLAIDSQVPPDAGIDLSATLSQDGKHVTLFAVNDGVAAETRTLNFSAFGGGSHELEVWTLADSDRAGEPDAVNSFARPERIAPKRTHRKVASPTFRYAFPPLSLTVLRW